MLQVSANGTDWVVTTGSNKAWVTADDAVTLITGTNKTLTARVIDTAGNFTALPLSDNSYTLDTNVPSVLAGTHTVLPVAVTQSAPLALTCKVSPVAKIRSLAKDKVTLT
jgi:hypothetical protein